MIKEIGEIVNKAIKNPKIKILVSHLPIKFEDKMYFKISLVEGNKEKLSFYLLLDDLLGGKFI